MLSTPACAGLPRVVAARHEVCPEIQEIYGDQFLGTRNVRDIMDTANDLLFGILGATVFVLVYKGTEWYQLKRAQPRRIRKRRT